jgi:hypothetical protein
MTTTHGSETPEPDDARGGFIDTALTDTGNIRRGPAFATGDKDAIDVADGRADGLAADGSDTEAIDADGNGDDDDFAPRARQRFGALSAVLVVALAIALGFLGGEIVQKHYGTTASASGAANRAAGFARGEGAGAFGGNGAGFPQAGANGNGAGTGPGTTGTGTGTGTTGSSPTPAVIGTVSSIKGSTLIVTNLGGAKVTVHLTGTTTVTVPVKAKALKVGQTVSVVGKTAAKVVTATSIVVQ